MLTAVGIIALVHLLSVLAMFLGVLVLGIGCTVLAGSIRDWLKLRLLADKALPGSVITLDQLAQLPKEDELDG